MLLLCVLAGLLSCIVHFYDVAWVDAIDIKLSSALCKLQLILQVLFCNEPDNVKRDRPFVK